MQGATLNVTGVAVVTNIQKGNSEDWVTAELVEAPAATESSKGSTWEQAPIRARLRVNGTGLPTEGSIIEIRNAILSKSKGEYEGKPTVFWNVAIFSWRELASAPAATKGVQPAMSGAVTAKPTTRRPVMDDPTPFGDDETVPF